jgi:hypothetical protein
MAAINLLLDGLVGKGLDVDTRPVLIRLDGVGEDRYDKDAAFVSSFVYSLTDDDLEFVREKLAARKNGYDFKRRKTDKRIGGIIRMGGYYSSTL